MVLERQPAGSISRMNRRRRPVVPQRIHAVFDLVGKKLSLRGESYLPISKVSGF